MITIARKNVHEPNANDINRIVRDLKVTVHQLNATIAALLAGDIQGRFSI